MNTIHDSLLGKNRLLRRNLFAFFFLGLLLLLLAQCGTQMAAATVSSLIVWAVVLVVVLNYIGIFRFIYSQAAMEGRDFCGKLRRTFCIAVLWLCTIGILAYSIARALGMIGAGKIGVEPMLINGINQLTASMQNDPAAGLAYLMGLFFWIVLLSAVTLLSCCWSASKSFENFRVLAAIFLTILLIITEQFFVKFFSAVIVDALGGISHLFTVIPQFAVLAVLSLENLLLVLTIIIDLGFVKLWMNKKKRKEGR